MRGWKKSYKHTSNDIRLPTLKNGAPPTAQVNERSRKVEESSASVSETTGLIPPRIGSNRVGQGMPVLSRKSWRMNSKVQPR